MRDFVWMVFSWYAISLLNSNTLEIFERKFLRRHNFAPLKEHDSFGNRILFSLLEQYKTHKGKKEKYYIYYNKLVSKWLMLLAAPWFVVMYFTQRYLVGDVLLWHYIIILCIGLLPMAVLLLLVWLCEIKLWHYRTKQKREEK